MQAIAFDFLLQALLLQGAIEAGNHHLRLKWLHQIVVRSGLHGQYPCTHIVEAGGDEKGYLRAPSPNFRKELHTIHPGHVEVADDGVAIVLFQETQSFRPTGHGLAVKIRFGQ